MSVREMKHNLRLGRWSGVHEFTIDFAVRISDQTVCAEYDTIVVNEVDELFSANGKDVKLIWHGKKIALVLPSGRKIKARRVKESQC